MPCYEVAIEARKNDTAEKYMIRVMSAVSAKMAAERGIARQPLAVLSQSEISRRMSAI